MSNPLQPQQFQQLPLFMSGAELRSIRSGDGSGNSEATYAEKLDEAKATGLHDAIGREGVKDPVLVDLDDDPLGFGDNGPTIYAGNHRVASAGAHDKEFVPVLFDEQTDHKSGEAWEHLDNAYPKRDGSGFGSLSPWGEAEWQKFDDDMMRRR